MTTDTLLSPLDRLPGTHRSAAINDLQQLVSDFVLLDGNAAGNE